MAEREPTVTSPLLRRLTAGAVLDALRAAGAVTGTDLMAATGLSRPTVHVVCDDLIRLGWVREVTADQPARGSRPGRRARRYEFNARAGYVLGIDIGAHKVVAVVADLRGDTVAELTTGFRHDRVAADERLDVVRRAVATALTDAGLDRSALLAVGVGVPAPVDNTGHVVAHEEYLPGLARVHLPSALGRHFDRPVHLENDANLAALAERWRGVAAGLDDVVMLLAGERFGAGLYLRGRLVRGSTGGAGEMGFLGMVREVGDADAIASTARRLGAAAVARGRRRGGALFALANGNPDAVQAETVFAAVRAGDPGARDILDRVADRTARVIAVLGTLLNPDLVVLGGAVAAAGDVLLGPIERRLPELTTSPPRIAVSSLADHAVVVGAVRLALDRVEAGVFDTSPSVPNGALRPDPGERRAHPVGR